MATIKVSNVKENECSGCTACLNICPVNAIKMKPNEEGFMYPIIDEDKCINCGLCSKICPFSKDWFEKNKNNEPVAYAAKNLNETVRLESSSGGAFSAIAEYMLKKGGVVYGASLENLCVKHIRIDNADELYKLRKSKYVQSEINDCFKKVLEDLKLNRQVLFSGTPCQVAGLKSFLKEDYTNLFTVDVVCHGVPSSKLFEDHIAMLEKKYNKKVYKYNFRSKVKGWHKQLQTVIFDDNTELFKGDYVQAYKYLYGGNSILRKSCSNCKFANVRRISDLTLGDFWGIERIQKSFDDNKGVSLLLVNNDKGKILFNAIRDNIQYINFNVENCLQPCLQRPTRASKNREKFWKQYKEKGYEGVIKKYSTLNLKNKIKYFIYGIFPSDIKKIIKRMLGK